MADRSAIEWTDATLNPVTGCSKVSPGCRGCYAERMATRLQAMGQPRYRGGFKVTLHRDVLDKPRSWRRPRNIFVNSMSDTFHHEVTEDFIQSIFALAADTPQHRYQVLTKRPERALELSARLAWPANLWLGVSVENEDYLYRVDLLRRIPASLRFLSLEPLLGPLPTLALDGISWVICGGESGPRSRPMEEQWALQILAQCQQAGVPFFFKQWGGRNKKKAGRILAGRTWDQYPADAVG